MSWIETPCSREALPDEAGSYVLEFELDAPIEFREGRFEGRNLGPGRIRYYGSAHGPGGLAGRVGRHLETSGQHKHWHVDYLTARLDVTRVYVEVGADECELLARDRRDARWRVPIDGFGATDCEACPAHLLIADAEDVDSSA